MFIHLKGYKIFYETVSDNLKITIWPYFITHIILISSKNINMLCYNIYIYECLKIHEWKNIIFPSVLHQEIRKNSLNDCCFIFLLLQSQKLKFNYYLIMENQQPIVNQCNYSWMVKN